MQSPILLTFGENNFRKSKFRLIDQALKTSWFSKCIGLDSNFLIDNLEINKRISDPLRIRGYGYWVWKSYIIFKTLQTMKENEILVYLDAGCSLNLNAKENFFNFIKLLTVTTDKSIIAFALGLPEIKYTKRDLFVFLNCDTPKFTNSNYQIISGLHIWKNTEFARKIANDWFNISLIDNLIDDSPSTKENYPGFIENRHDQSIFSLLLKKNIEHCHIFDDQSYYVDFNSPEAKMSSFPFFATRISDDKF